MFNLIDIKEYEDKLKSKKYDEIYKDIAEKSLKLSAEILKIKDEYFKEDQSMESKFIEIEVIFERHFGIFGEMFFLMRYLQNWNDDLLETPEESKIDQLITAYNILVNELEHYKEKELEIKEKGFETMRDETAMNLKKLYIEMLEFKNKECSEDDKLMDLTRKAAHYYNFLEEDIYNAESALFGGFITRDVEEPEVLLNETERIMIANETISYLTPSDEDPGYKEYANYYDDYDLKEGQTYSDLYDEKANKLINLLKEMLEFVGVDVTEKQCNLSDLRYLVSEHYPFYEGSLSLLRWGNPNETYISKFDTMDKVYERLSSDYKNYEKNMEEYKNNKK